MSNVLSGGRTGPDQAGPALQSRVGSRTVTARGAAPVREVAPSGSRRIMAEHPRGRFLNERSMKPTVQQITMISTGEIQEDPQGSHKQSLARLGVAQQLPDTRGALRPGVEFEIEIRRIAKSERAANLTADEASSAPKPGNRLVRPRPALDMREKHAGVSEIIGHRDAGERNAAQPRVLQVANQHLRKLAEHELGDAFRSPSFLHRFVSSPTPRVLAVDDFELLLAQRRQPERVDEVHDFAQGAVYERAVAADLADAEFRALPHVVPVGLSNRDVELVADTVLDGPEHLPFALERMVFRQEKS